VGSAATAAAAVVGEGWMVPGGAAVRVGPATVTPAVSVVGRGEGVASTPWLDANGPEPPVPSPPDNTNQPSTTRTSGTAMSTGSNSFSDRI
jgi:hypothetical protein